MKAVYFSCAMLCLLPACMPKKHIKKVTIFRDKILRCRKPDATPPISVWVHGTRFIRRPFFYECFDGVPCLRLVSNIDPESSMYQIAHTLNQTAPDHYPLDTFYAFGWSGKLKSETRIEAAHHLYYELQRVVDEYIQKYGCEPRIRIITHSHGGTVALNLARVERRSTDVPFQVDELILLACPVQRSTKQFIENDIFKYTCALCSGLDMVQVLAPQFTYTTYTTKKDRVRSHLNWPPFSNRHFEKHPKLAQAKLKIDGRALFHTEFTSNRFISLLPQILQVLNNCHKHTEYDTQLLCVYTRDKDEENENA